MAWPACCLIVLLLSSLSAQAQDALPKLEWMPVREKLTQHRALIDSRSPVMEHEWAVKPGEDWKFAGHVLVFTRDGGRLAITDTPPGEHAAKVVTTISPPDWVSVELAGGPYALSVRWDGERVQVSSAMGLAVAVGMKEAYLVDSDLDAVLGSRGDGIVVPDSRTVGPMQAPWSAIYSTTAAVALASDGQGGWQVAALPMPKAGDQDHAAAWRLLQWNRQACGLLPLKYDATLEKGMKLHIDYLVRNNRYSHYENPQHPGYTVEGARAGMTSVIGKLKSNHLEAVGSQLTSMFHRSSCLAPELETSAMLLDRQHFMASTKMHNTGPLKGRPLVYPGHGMVNVPCEFSIAGESPLPFEGAAANNGRGTVVGVRWAQHYYTTRLPTAPRMTLEVQNWQGAWDAVEGDLYHPGKAPKSAGVLPSNMGHTVIVPRRFLKPDSLHRVRVAMPGPVIEGENKEARELVYEWEFRTGESRKK